MDQVHEAKAEDDFDTAQSHPVHRTSERGGRFPRRPLLIDFVPPVVSGNRSYGLAIDDEVVLKVVCS